MGKFDPYTPLSETNMLDVKPLSSSPSSSPVFTKHRVVTAVDAGDVTTAGSGMNMAGFERAIIRVVPGDNTNVNVEVMSWSEVDGKFVSANPKLTAVGLGDGVSYDFSIDAHSRVIFVYVTGTIGGSEQVVILIAGAELDHKR